MARPAPDLLARPAVCGRPTGMILTRAFTRALYAGGQNHAGPATCSRAPVGSPASALRADHCHSRGRFDAFCIMGVCDIIHHMKMKRLLLPAIVCILMIAALSFALFGFRRYVNHCYVASWLERCQPYMTAEDVFSVLPDRFYRDCLVTQVDCAMPYVCFLPSDCSKVEIEYACRLRSDVDRLSLFLESCSLYFDKDRRLVGICYCPHNNTLDNKSWEQFVHCREPHVPKEYVPTNNGVVVASCNGSVVYMSVKDWYKQKDKWNNLGTDPTEPL